MTKDIFNRRVEKFLMPSLPEGCTVILDNARFHKYPEIEKRVSERGHTVLWLPTYPPGLNPIEKYWAK